MHRPLALLLGAALACACTTPTETDDTDPASTTSDSGSSDSETGELVPDLPAEDCELDEGATFAFEFVRAEDGQPYSAEATASCTYAGSSAVMNTREHSLTDCMRDDGLHDLGGLTLRTTTTTDFEIDIEDGTPVRLTFDTYQNEGWIVMTTQDDGLLLLALCAGRDFDFEMGLAPLIVSRETRECDRYFDDGGCTLWRPVRLWLSIEDEFLGVAATQSGVIGTNPTYRVDVGRAEKNVGVPSCESIPDYAYEFLLARTP